MLGGEDGLVDWRHARRVAARLAQSEYSLQLTREGGGFARRDGRDTGVQDVHQIGIHSVVAHLNRIANDAARSADRYPLEQKVREASVELKRAVPHAQSLAVRITALSRRRMRVWAQILLSYTFIAAMERTSKAEVRCAFHSSMRLRQLGVVLLLSLHPSSRKTATTAQSLQRTSGIIVAEDDTSYANRFEADTTRRRGKENGTLPFPDLPTPMFKEKNPLCRSP